jgi:hypothetical protein
MAQLKSKMVKNGTDKKEAFTFMKRVLGSINNSSFTACIMQKTHSEMDAFFI